MFSGMGQWSREQFGSQISVFPEGQLYVEYMGRVVASSSSLIVECDLYSDWHKWKEIADSGYLRVRTCAQARCIENHIYTAIAGCTGNLPAIEHLDVHYAQSDIYSPSDFSFSRDCIVAECNPNIETVVIHDVDLQLLRRHRLSGTVQNWRDRRSYIYKLRYKEGDDYTEI